MRVHPVVQAAARSATPQPMRDQAARAAARALLLQAWPADGGQPLLADALRSCAASLKQAAAESLWEGGAPTPSCSRPGGAWTARGSTGPAVVHWRSLASASERVLGPSHQDSLLAVDRLANALLAAGMGAEAVALRQRTVEARSGAKGPDHPGTIAARADLGQALLAAGRPADAIIVLEAALAASGRGPVPDGIDPLVLQDTLSGAYAGDGRYQDAIRLARRTLADRERRQGSGHPDTMAARAHLAGVFLPGGGGRRMPSPTASAPWRTGNGCWAPTTRTPLPP